MRAREPVSAILAEKSVSHRHTTTSFTKHVMVAKTSYRNASKFSILRSGNGLVVFNNITRAGFLAAEKKLYEEFFLCIGDKSTFTKSVCLVPDGEGVLPQKLGRGVRSASQNPYPIYDRDFRFSLPYL